MRNITPQSTRVEPLERTVYLFFGHKKPSEDEEIAAIRKSSLHEPMPDRKVGNVVCKAIKITLGDGWESAD